MLAGNIVQDPRLNFIYCYADSLPSEAGITINQSQSPKTSLRYSSSNNWSPSLLSPYQGLIGFSYDPNTFVFGDTFTVTSNTGNMPVSAYASATSSLLLYLDASSQQSYPGSGTNWKDLSRNGPRNCTLTNGPTFTSANNGAIVFDGVDDYVACGNLGSFPSQGSISFWMYSTAVENYRNPFSTAYLNGNACIRFEQYTTASPYGGFNVVIGNDQGTYAGYSYSPSAVLSANTWYNIALAWNTSSSSLSGYMDGILKFTTNNHTYWPTTLPSVTLGSGFDSGRYFKGSIAGVQMWNRAITAPEMFQNYSFQKDELGLGGQVITDSLISYLNVSDSKSYPGSGSTITDLSNNGNSATISGSPTFSNGVLTFNGVDQFAYLSNPGFFDISGNSNYADIGYAWSVSIWFKFPVTPTTVRNSTNNGGNCSWCMIGRGGGIGGAETLALFVSSNDGSTSAGTLNPYFLVAGIRGAKTKISPGSVNNNTWYFVTLTWNGTAGRAYLNGEDRGPLNIGGAGIQTGVYFNVGSTASAPSAHGFEGSIGQVYTYNRAINFLEHLKNFYSGAIQYNWYISELITNGLVLSLDASYYLSYPGSGTTWTDTSGNNNTGTLTNGPTFDITNGGSIVFDGVDDYVNIPYNASTISFSNNNATICVWYKAATTGDAAGALVTQRSQSGSGFQTYCLSNKFYADGGGTAGIYSVSSITIGTIGFACAVYDKTNSLLKLYINGNFDSQISYPGNIQDTYPIRLANGAFGDGPFPGNIYSVLVYNRALSTSEIAKNFNATKTRFGL